MKLTPEEYKKRLNAAFLVAADVIELDLEELLSAMQTADNLGPYLDPTAWMRNGEALRTEIRIVGILLSAQRQLLPQRGLLLDEMLKECQRVAQQAQQTGT